jgi:hypothetical protein
LGKEVLEFDIGKPKAVQLSDWEDDQLTEAQTLSVPIVLR